jgi:hypothetical protein
MKVIAEPRIAATKTQTFTRPHRRRTLEYPAEAGSDLAGRAKIDNRMRRKGGAVARATGGDGQPKTAPPIRVPKRPTPTDRIPRVVPNPTLQDHLAIMTRAVFQAGLSWAMIDLHWEDYQRAFDGFDVVKVAGYDDADVERLMRAGGVVHSRPKIAGTVRNARALLDLEREFGSIASYQQSFASYDALRRDTRKRFAYLGDLNTYYWVFRTGGAVPDLEEWMKGQERDHPRMREMVQLAKRGA